MPKRIPVATHLNLEELEQRYRQATYGIQSRQYQIIWILTQGEKTADSGIINYELRNLLLA